MIKDAILDKERKYRYMLKRQWGECNNNFINFVLLNPSTANETVEDPTIKACIKFSQNFGYDGFYVTNLFAFRTKSPNVLKKSEDPIGDENDKYIKEYARKSKLVVIAWGNHGNFLNRNNEVLKILSEIKTPHCLAVTNLGNPKHPLYIKRNTNTQEWLETDLNLVRFEPQKCLCQSADCAKCLLINCTVENCKIHTKDKKQNFRIKYKNRQMRRQGKT